MEKATKEILEKPFFFENLGKKLKESRKQFVEEFRMGISVKIPDEICREIPIVTVRRIPKEIVG